MGEKIDKGFCASYWRLSYRRKFIRTLWTNLFVLIFFLFPADYRFLGMERKWFIVFMLALGTMQAGYAFYKWKKRETRDE